MDGSTELSSSAMDAQQELGRARHREGGDKALLGESGGGSGEAHRRRNLEEMAGRRRSTRLGCLCARTEGEGDEQQANKGDEG